MSISSKNLLENICTNVTHELFDTLAESGTIRIERIVSDGHATPPGEWYDQEWDEWVLLVSGGATLLFDNDSASLVLAPGDYIMIPAGCRHRVEHTDTTQKTVWLAVHFAGEHKE
jgi:cupin 2 domain-containing protein